MARAFNNPGDMYDYGKMINDFSEAGKDIAHFMDKMGLSQEEILPIVGRGRYNTLEAQGYVLRGPAAHKSARDHIEGLFGAFFYVHLPELRMAMQLPKLLGEAGVTIGMEDGRKRYSIGLDEVKLGFQTTPPAIVLDEDATLTAADGTTRTLTKGTKVMQGRSRVPSILVRDVSDKTLSDDILYPALWGQQGAKGMKSLPPQSKQLSTLQSTGTDDDFTAERAMIDALTQLKARHHIDLMPAFSGFMQAAHDGLVARPALLQSCVDAIALADAVDEKVSADLKQIHGNYTQAQYWNRLQIVVNAGDSIRHMLSMLEIDISQGMVVSTQAQQVIGRVLAQLDITLPEQRVMQQQAREKYEAQMREHAERSAAQELQEKLVPIREKLAEQIRFDGDVLDVVQLRSGHSNKLCSPGTWHLQKARINGQLAALGSNVPTIEQLAADIYQRQACKQLSTALAGMKDFFDFIPRRAWVQQAPDLYDDRWKQTMQEAASAIGDIRSHLQYAKREDRHLDIPDLPRDIARIQKAVQLLEGIFANEAIASPRSGRPFRANERRTFQGTDQQWRVQYAPKCRKLLALMETVQQDPQQWMALYRNTDRVEGRAPAATMGGHVARLQQQAEGIVRST